MNLEDKYLWVEKYRPKKIDDVVLPDEHHSALTKYINDGEIPNLLFIGTQGTGKTTIARILLKEILKDSEDCLPLNGSSATGVDIVRYQIEDFLKVPSFGGSKIKIVFIDEFDYMSVNAMAALRNIMERYHDTGRFLLTANYKSKISDPIFSRVTSFDFKKLPKEFIRDYCKTILEKEQIKFDLSYVEKIVSTYYPDVRRVVNFLQGKVNDNNEIECDYDTLISNEKKSHSYVSDLCVGLKNNNVKLIQTAIENTHRLLNEVELDYISLYQDMYEDLGIPIWAKIVINRYANQHQSCMIPAMHWCAMMYEIGKIGKDFYNLKR